MWHLFLTLANQSTSCLPLEEVNEHRPTTSSVEPLLVHFPNGCAPNGVFCALVVYLLSSCGWKISYRDSSPICVSRNCIEFQLPDPGSVTLIDSFAYLEVHVVALKHLYPIVCPEVRSAIFSGLQQASHALKYGDLDLEDAFFCSCTTPPHAATLCVRKHGHYWRCSQNPALYSQLEQKHTVWFENMSTPPSNSGQCMYYLYSYTASVMC